MGFFTDLLGGPGKTREYGGGVDEYIKPYTDALLKKAEEYMGRPFTPYELERFAEFTPEELKAFEQSIGISEREIEDDPYFKLMRENYDLATGMMKEAGRQITGKEIQDAMSPFTQAVLDPQLRAIREGEQAQQQEVRAKAAGGAGFGSRLGLLESEIGRSGMQTRADVTGETYAKAFESAREFLTGEKGRAADIASNILGAGTAYGKIGQDIRARELENIGLLAQVGETKRGLEQKKKDFSYDEFLRQQGYEPSQIALMSDVVGGIPLRQTQYTQDPSTFQELIGIGTAAGSMAAGGMKIPGFKKSGGSIKDSVYREGGGGILSSLKNMFTSAKDKAAEAWEATKDFFTDDEDETKQIKIEDGSTPETIEKEIEKEVKEETEKQAKQKINEGLQALGKAFETKNLGTSGTYSGKGPTRISKYSGGSYADGGAIGNTVYRQQAGQVGGDEFGNQNFLEIVLGLFGDEDDSTQPAPQPPSTQPSRPAAQTASTGSTNQPPATTTTTTQPRQGAAQPAAIGLRNLPPQGRPQITAAQLQQFQKTPMAGQEQEEKVKEEGVLSRILSGVKKGAGILATPFNYYYENIDPFREMSSMDRFMMGMSILAQQPELGESPLTTVAKGIVQGREPIETRELAAAKKKANSLKSFHYNNVLNAIAGEYAGMITRDPATGEIKYIGGDALNEEAAKGLIERVRQAQNALIRYNSVYDDPDKSLGAVLDDIESGSL